MKFLAVFVASLFLIGLFFASSLIAAELNVTVADPATTTTGASFRGLSKCVKDKTEAHAYCGSWSAYIVKLDLDPNISFSAEFDTDSDSSVLSVALFEGTSSSRLFYNDDGTIKYINVADLGGSPTPTTVDNSAVSSSYSVASSSSVLLDAANKIIYVGGEGKIYKIINIDSTPVFSSDVIDLPNAGDDAGDLILANGDLYVALADYNEPGKVWRIASPETSTATTSKTVTFSTYDESTDSSGGLHQSGNFIYAVTPKYGIVVKMSIGSTDDDFALVGSSAGAVDTSGSETYAYLSLLTPDSAYLIVVSYDSGKIYAFDIAAMEYQTDALDGPDSTDGGVLTSSGHVALVADGGSILRNYEFEVSTSSPGDPSSAGASSVLSVFFLFAFVLLVA